MQHDRITVRVMAVGELPQSARAVRWVDAGPAEVLVAPPGWPADPDPAVARVAVGEPAGDRAADLAVSREDFAADPAGVAVRGWAARMVLRPTSSDAPERWLEAVRVHLCADLAARVERHQVHAAGLDDGADAVRALAAACPPLAVWDTRPTMPGSAGRSLDAAAAAPIGPHGEHGVLVVGVVRAGAPWAARVAQPLRTAALAAAWRASADARTAERAEREETDQLLRALFRIAGHDLGNTLFAARLAARALARDRPGATESIDRSLGTAIAQLRRVVEAGRAVLEGFRVAPGTTELRPSFDRVAAEVLRAHPERPIAGAPPEVRVAVGATALERLLSALLSNAATHGDPDEPVRVDGILEGDAVRVEVRNRGKLPFAELDRIEPFEHRRGPGLGFDLWYARRLAWAAGVALSLRAADDEVVATLRLPLTGSRA